MRAVDPAAQAQRERRGALLEVPMIWVAGRDRATNEVHGIGFWQGADAENIAVVDMFTGETAIRTFYAGGILEIGSVRHEAGLNIRPVKVRLSGIDTATQIAFRQYDPRGCQVQVWKRAYDPATRLPIGIEPWFKGYVNSAPIERAAPGGEGGIEVDIVSTARMLTITSARKKSDADQQSRLGDRFRRYKGTTRAWDVPWGTKDVRS